MEVQTDSERVRLSRAGGDQDARASDLDDAHAADVDRGQVFRVAEVGCGSPGCGRHPTITAGTVTLFTVDRQRHGRWFFDDRCSSMAGWPGRVGGRRAGCRSAAVALPPARRGRARRGAGSRSMLRPSLTAPPYPAGAAPIRSPLTPSGRGRRSTRPASPAPISRSSAASSSRRGAGRQRQAASNSPWRTVPTRHGTHWPHDSSRKNAAMPAQRVDEVGGLVEHHHHARTERGAHGARRFEGQRHVQRAGPTKTRPRHPAAPPGLPAAGHAAGQIDEVRRVAPNSTS